MGMGVERCSNRTFEMLLQGRYLATERGWLFHLHLLCGLLETSCLQPTGQQLLKARMLYARIAII